MITTEYDYEGFGAPVLGRELPFIHENGAWVWDRTYDPLLHRAGATRRALDGTELRVLRDTLQRSLDVVVRQIAAAEEGSLANSRLQHGG